MGTRLHHEKQNNKIKRRRKSTPRHFVQKAVSMPDLTKLLINSQIKAKRPVCGMVEATKTIIEKEKAALAAALALYPWKETE
jgi:hypothetical protein